MDKNLLLFYIGSSLMWFLFMLIEVADGAYVTPTRPGWSLDMHPDFIATHTYPTGAVWRGREASGSIGFLA